MKVYKLKDDWENEEAIHANSSYELIPKIILLISIVNTRFIDVYE